MGITTYPGGLFKSSHFNSFEDGASVDDTWLYVNVLGL